MTHPSVHQGEQDPSEATGANKRGADKEAHSIQVGDAKLTFNDPVVTGRQILESAGHFPPEEFLVFQRLTNGQLEEIRLDETVDLRAPGIERFYTFRSDRSFRFVVDGRRFEWGMATITGRTLKALAGVPTEYGVWLERRNDDDLPIGDAEDVDLSQPGVERFFTGKTTTTEG